MITYIVIFHHSLLHVVKVFAQVIRITPPTLTLKNLFHLCNANLRWATQNLYGLDSGDYFSF
jgi:hypothetical protein